MCLFGVFISTWVFDPTFISGMLFDPAFICSILFDLGIPYDS